MATAAWGGTVTGVDAPKKSDEYVYNPNDFGGISQEQAKANNAKLAQSGLGLAGGSGNESVTRNQSGIGGASFGGSSTNSNGIIGGQMQAAQVATPTQWNVTAPQTVQGQIKDIINPNSPIMQQARTGALEQMNSRGLVNSSMAITAGDDAAYRAAIPIATADASTYAKSASYNADAQNQVNLANAQYANQAGQSNLSANTQTSIAKMNDDTQKQLSTLDAATRTNIAKMNDDTQKQLSTLDVATRTNLQTLQNENQVLLNTNSQASSLFSNATSALNNIAMSTTMDGPTKQDASAQVWSNLQAQIKVLSATSKLNLSSILGVDVGTNPYYIPPPSAEALRDRTNPPGPGYVWDEARQSWVQEQAAPPAPSNNADWLQT